MAYVADFVSWGTATAATSKAFVTADFPIHAANDYLVICCSVEAEATTTITASGGQAGSTWTQIGTTQGTGTTANGIYTAVFYKKCINASEAGTFTYSVSTEAHFHILLIKDADLTTFLDGTPANAFVSVAASQFTSDSITTTQPNSLLLYFIGTDHTTTTPTQVHTAPGPIHFIESSDNGGANVTAGSKAMAGIASGWYVQATPGATPTPSWNASLALAYTKFTIGIRHNGTGIVPAYIDDSATIGTKVMDGHWWVSATTRNNENFKATPLSITSIITHLGTLTGTFDAAASVVDVHINPYSAAISTTPATSATALTGFEVGFPTTAINMSTGWLVGTLLESTPKAANFTAGDISKGGVFLLVGDASNNYRIFQILAKDNLVNAEGRAVFSVQINQTQTQSGQSAVAPNTTAINKLMILQRGNTGALATYCCDFHIINKLIVAGGSDAQPVDSQGVYNIGKFLRIKLVTKLGAAELQPVVPLQIGGGDPVNFQIDAGALQFPRIYDRTKKEINYHGTNNAIGISYAGKSGDIIKHTNSVITSPSPYYWEINAAATSAATWDFSGLVIVGATVTLRPVMTFDSISFTSCPTITLNSSTVTNCSFKNSNIVATTLADAALVSNSIITKTTGTQHGITISGTASVITLTGLTFTGYAASNGSTGNEAIYVNIASGNVTINLVGGGNTPSIRTAGAVVTVNNAKIFTVTNVIDGSEVRIYNSSDLSEFGGVENVSTSSTGLNNVTVSSDPDNVGRYIVSYSYNYTIDTPITIVVLNNQYQALRTTGVLKSIDQSIPVNQIFDRQYLNPP